MSIREREETEARERVIAEIRRNHPPAHRLEDVMGPDPTADEADEVEAFLRLRDTWRQPSAGITRA